MLYHQRQSLTNWLNLFFGLKFTYKTKRPTKTDTNRTFRHNARKLVFAQTGSSFVGSMSPHFWHKYGA